MMLFAMIPHALDTLGKHTPLLNFLMLLSMLIISDRMFLVMYVFLAIVFIFNAEVIHDTCPSDQIVPDLQQYLLDLLYPYPSN